MPFRVIYQDESLVAIDKPSGFHVHPPEDKRHGIRTSQSCLHVLRDQLGRYLYPVHRLDRSTSGVLLFALDPEAARAIAEQFASGEVKKTYFAVARGWFGEDRVVDRELAAENPELPAKAARTGFRQVAGVEFPIPIGRYASARYSLVRAAPETGRLHQIRRHLAGEAHPLIGDTCYGDGKHNRFFRDELGIPGLLLNAHTLRLRHPATGAPLLLRSRWSARWHRVFERFGVCPFESLA